MKTMSSQEPQFEPLPEKDAGLDGMQLCIDVFVYVKTKYTS